MCVGRLPEIKLDDDDDDKNHKRSTEWYHFQWLWVTFDPEFKVTTFSTLNVSETTWYRAMVTISSTGSRIRPIEWWYFQWPWRTHNPVFQVTAFLKSNIGKTACLKDKVTIAHELKLYLTMKWYAPCVLQGRKNGSAPFPGWVSHKATKPGSVCPIS